jgi:ComEC/Rec2-related protein
MARSWVRRTTLITVGCFAAIAGVGLARKFTWEPWLLICPLLILPIFKRRFGKLLLIALLGLCFGLWRGSLYMEKLQGLQAFTNRKVTIQVVATNDAVYGNKSQLEFTANHVRLWPSGRELAGNFKISGYGVPMVYRGDILQVNGKIFPMRGSNQARMAYTQLKLLASDNSAVHTQTRRFAAGMENALPEPEASFGLGLLIGQRTNLSQDLLNSLTAVGLVHIVAVSGYNVTILARAAARLKLRSKFQRLALSLCLIGLFIAVTGFSASIVRASLVSLLTLWAWYYGRNIKPLVLIAFVAAATGLINPFYVWGDLGWYLSFLAFFGILVISPVIVKRLFAKPPRLYTLVLIETLAAEIMTLPLIMMTFGQLSAIALLANLIIVPLVPLAMLFCAVAGIAGMYMPTLAGWFAWPATSLLTFILDVVQALASFPISLLHLSISPAFMASFYLMVLITIWIMARKIRHKKTPELGAV